MLVSDWVWVRFRALGFCNGLVFDEQSGNMSRFSKAFSHERWMTSPFQHDNTDVDILEYFWDVLERYACYTQMWCDQQNQSEVGNIDFEI